MSDEVRVKSKTAIVDETNVIGLQFSMSADHVGICLKSTEPDFANSDEFDNVNLFISFRSRQCRKLRLYFCFIYHRDMSISSSLKFQRQWNVYRISTTKI